MPRFDSYDGTRLWYDLVGRGSPLVCLAGGPGADVRYLGDLGGLAEHRTLVRLDARAGGRSAVPTDRDSCAFTEQARDVEALRRHLGLSHLDLLAHSAGTLTAQEYAARYGTAARLVLVTPAGRVAREPDEDELGRVVRSATAAGAVTRVPDDDGLVEPPPWLRGAFYASGLVGEAVLPRLARLGAVPVPVLALAGGADPVAGTAPARLISGCYRRAVLAVLPGCGHYPWLDEPRRFRDTVVAFLDGRIPVARAGGALP